MGEPKQGKHFILVHGACHGAWCWYKLKPLLETAGHRVTALDMAASGIDLRRIQDVQTLRDYTEPLLDLLGSMGPDRDKVILVGHSLGGLNLGLAMELFPEKIDVAVFVTAFMLDSVHQPSYVLEQYGARGPEGGWLDTEFKCEGDPEDSLTTMFFGPLFLSQLYHLSPVEDFELAMALKRPSSLFLRDLKKAKKFTKERYDSVRRTYVICNEDKGIPEAFQQWMIDNNGSVDEVKKINGSDHMPMLCLPQNLCACLLEIAEKYA